MSKTDGKLLEKINGISLARLENINLLSVVLWTFSLLFLVIMSSVGMESYTCHGIIIMLLYFSGAMGMIFGGIYLYRKLYSCDKTNRERLYVLQPLLFLVILFIWNVFCTLFAEEKRVAIYGYESLRDNIFTFLFFGGLFLAGIVLSSNDKITKKLYVSLFSGALLTGFAIIVASDRFNLSSSLVVSGIEKEIDNCYFGSYFLLASMIAVILFLNTSKVIEKIVFFVGYVLLTLFIIVCNDSLSVWFSFLFLIAIIIINRKRTNKSVLLLLLGMLVVALFFSLLLHNADLVDINTFELVHDRMDSWHTAKKFISSVPIIGVGPQNTMKSAKNLILQIGMYSGVPGIIIFLASYLCLIVVAREYHNENRELILASFVFLMSLSMLGTTYYVAAFYYLIIGVCMGDSLNKMLKD